MFKDFISRFYLQSFFLLFVHGFNRIRNDNLNLKKIFQCKCSVMCKTKHFRKLKFVQMSRLQNPGRNLFSVSLQLKILFYLCWMQIKCVLTCSRYFKVSFSIFITLESHQWLDDKFFGLTVLLKILNLIRLDFSPSFFTWNYIPHTNGNKKPILAHFNKRICGKKKTWRNWKTENNFVPHRFFFI